MTDAIEVHVDQEALRQRAIRLDQPEAERDQPPGDAPVDDANDPDDDENGVVADRSGGESPDEPTTTTAIQALGPRSAATAATYAVGRYAAAARAGDHDQFAAAYEQLVTPNLTPEALLQLRELAADAARSRAEREQLPIDLAGVHELAVRINARSDALISMNLAVLECALRCTFGLNTYLARIGVRFAAVCLGVLIAGLEPNDTTPPSPGGRRRAWVGPTADRTRVRAAITCAHNGDPVGWCYEVDTGLAADLDTTVADAAEELRARLVTAAGDGELEVPSIVAISELLSDVAGTGFTCPPYVLEFAMRKAVGEPGCTDHLDPREFVLAAVQASAALDSLRSIAPTSRDTEVFAPVR